MDNSREPLWTPRGSHTNMDTFRERVNDRHSLSLASYQELWQWSVDQYHLFWEEFFLHSRILHSTAYEEVVDLSKTVADVPEWFRGCRMNYSENLLRHATARGDKTAIITAGEGQTPRHISFSQLRERVAAIAAALSAVGVAKGDVVAGYLPNSSLAVEAMLATASLGAIWTSTSPDFGITGVLDRLSQVRPKVIFSVEAVRYNAKTHDHLKKLISVVAGLPELKRVVLFPFCGSRDIDTSRIPNWSVSFFPSLAPYPSLSNAFSLQRGPTSV
jgi:acetoacetyl-CoA synthetase